MKKYNPRTKYTTSNMTVLIGRNAQENETLWLTMNGNQDTAHYLWFHLDDHSSPHVILVSEHETPTKRDIMEAALYVKEFSCQEIRNQAPQKTRVVYCPVSNLTKKRAREIGSVNFLREPKSIRV